MLDANKMSPAELRALAKEKEDSIIETRVTKEDLWQYHSMREFHMDIYTRLKTISKNGCIDRWLTKQEYDDLYNCFKRNFESLFDFTPKGTEIHCKYVNCKNYWESDSNKIFEDQDWAERYLESK